MTDMRQTAHWDAVEAGAICHEQCAIAEIERLRAELESLKRSVLDLSHPNCRMLLDVLDVLRTDAERYRWLRQVDRCEQWENLLMVRPITRTEDVDAAIDAARSKE